MSDPQVDNIHDNITSLSISPDGKQVTFGSIDGALTIWDTDHRRHVCAPIMAHQLVINAVCYSTDGRLIASASDDQTIGLWEASTGQSTRGTFTDHEHGVLVVGFMTDTRTVVSLSRDRVVLVWKATTSEVEQQCRISLDARSLAALSHDGGRLLAAHRKGITVWNTITMESIKTITLEGPMVLCMGLSEDATKVAFGMADNSIHLWDVEKGEMDPPHLEGGKELPLYVAWSPDGRTVSSVAQDATLRVWSVESRQCMSKGHRTMGPITYSPGGSFIVCPGDDGSPDIWEVPQIPCHSSTLLLEPSATAIFMSRAAGATESNVFWGVSDDVPVTSTQHAQCQRTAEGPPSRNTLPETKGFFSRILQKLSVRRKDPGATATTECGNPAIMDPETRREMPQPRHVTATQHPTNLDVTYGVSSEQEVPSRRMSTGSDIPGCLLCRKG